MIVDSPPTTPVASSSFARLSRDSVVFALGSFGGKVIALALLPIVTRLLTPAQYGHLDLLSTLGSAAISVLLLGMSASVTRLALDPAHVQQERAQLVGTWLTIQLAVVVSFAAILLVIGDTISRQLLGTEISDQSVQLVSLIVVAGTLHYLALTVLRIQQRAVAYTTLVLGTLGLNALLAVVLLTGWVRDERAPLLAYGLSLAAGSVFGLLAIGSRWFARPRAATARAILALSLPLLPAIAATWVAEFVNRGILIGSAGAAELGYFSVALRFASVAGLLVVGFQLAWQPRAFALGTGSKALAQTGEDGRRILLLVSAVVVLVAAGSPEMVQLVSGPAFMPSLPALGLSLCTVLATASYLVASMPSALGNRFKDIGISGLVGVAVGLATNAVLAPYLGSLGTALAATLGQGFATVHVWLLGRRSFALQLPWGRVTAILLAAGIVSIASTLPEGGAPLSVRCLLVAVFLLVLAREGAMRSIRGWFGGQLA